MQLRLVSPDRELQWLLSNALGQEFQLQCPDPDPDSEDDPPCVDAVLVDLTMAGAGLQQRLQEARQLIASNVCTIVLVDEEMRGLGEDLLRQGAFGCCQSPPSILDLVDLLRRAQRLHRIAVHRGIAPLPAFAGCDQMIGSSALMQRVYHIVHCVADHDAPVMVTGESGTGKELIARAIHNLGVRSTSPFVAVSCGAIPETLLESELFGHEKGAFTGTVGSREGYFELAGNGTLFLDEIGDLTHFAQIKLLRVLQQREFSRLGSNRLIPLRARLVFATHRDLRGMVADGSFRQDLYYRLNVVAIEAPSLRDHPQDIPELALHFAQHYAQIYHMPSCAIAPEALNLLKQYPWPGNVRELEHVIQSTLILAGGQTIQPMDLPEHIRPVTAKVLGIDGYRETDSFEQQIIDYKIKLAMDAVSANNGNKTLAARSLNISRAYLHRLLRLDDLDPALPMEGSQEQAV
jgi:DNA-binding NtrC family response regulator